LTKVLKIDAQQYMTEEIKMKCSKAIIIALLLTSAILAFSKSARAQATPEIFIDPATATASSVGQTININVNITNVVGLFSWELRVYFNPTLLLFSNYQSGGFMSQFGGTFPLVVDNKTNLGYAQFGETFSEDMTAQGNGTLVKITFTVLAGGRCPLSLLNSNLYDSGLATISHTTTNGLFILNYVKLTPANGTGAFAIQGYGFQNNSLIEVTWNGTPLLTYPEQPQTDATGYFLALATIPENSTAGNYIILARDSVASSKTAIFTLKEIAGPIGPTGPQGTTGPAGAAGQDGASAPMEYTWLALILAIVALLIAVYGFMRKK